MPIPKHTPEIKLAIDVAHDVALNAVDHVGAANYAHREFEARVWIDDAFAKLRAAISLAEGK